MTLKELIDLLRVHLRLLLAITFGATLLVAVVSFIIPNSYTASVSMQVISESGDPSQAQSMANDIAALLATDGVKTTAAEDVKLADAAAYSVSVESSTTSRVIGLSVEGPDADTAGKLCARIATNVSKQATSDMGVASLYDSSSADPSVGVSGPPRKQYIAIAFLGGLFAAVALIVCVDMVRPRVHSVEEASELLDGMPVVGRIPQVGDADAARDADRTTAHDAAKTLLANIRFCSDERPVRAIVVTSAARGEGKTTVSLELAQSIASSGKRVLLVEANLRHPSLGELVIGGQPEGPVAGYCDVLAGRVQLSKTIHRLKQPNLFFLDAGTPDVDPADVFADDLMPELVDKLRNGFDYVVFDAPAAARYVDAAVLAHIADATLLVLRPNAPLLTELAAAHDELGKAKARVLGICANDYPVR